MSDKSRQVLLDQIAATVNQLGIAPNTPVDALPPVVRDLLADYLNDGVTEYSAEAFAPAELESAWQKVGGTAKTQTVDATAKKANADGVVTPGEQKNIDEAKTGAGPLAATPDSPPWIYELFNQAPTPEQEKRIASEWNDVFGTKFTYDELITLPQFADPTETVQKVVQAAQLDIEPQVEYTVTLPGNRSYKITGDQQKTQFGLYGYDNKDVVRIVRWADTFNLKDSTGNTAWQPLAALLKASKFDLAIPNYKDRSGYDPETGKKLPVPASQRHRGKPGAPPADDKRAAQNEMSLAQLTNDYKQNLKKFGDPTMAYLGTLDSGLATRLMASGGDSDKVTNEDTLLTQQLLLNGQWSPEGMAALGYAGGEGMKGFMNRLAGSAAAGGAGSVRMKADPEALKQGVKDFWRTMFRSDPSEATVAQMVGELQAAAAAAPDDQSFDPAAKLRSLAEADPQYKTLYGNKQPGQTEADYQNQFLGASSDLLGNEAPDNGAILAGMRTGDYQTTVGATAGSSRAWNNSKFMGRLANAATILNERT